MTVAIRILSALMVSCLLLPVAVVCAQEDTPRVSVPGIGLYGTTFETEQETIEHIRKCKAYGITVLYPSLSGGGTVIWKTDKELYYTPYKKVMDEGFDSLASFIKHAHAAGIKVYPSIAVSPVNNVIADHPEWETLDREGNPSSVTTTRAFSLAYPAARAAKIAMIMDLVNGYDIDGIMLDYCRYPETTKTKKTAYGFYGYDPPLIDACKTIYGFDPREVPIDSPRWNLFNQMRADTVTAFVREFGEAVKASGRDIRIGGFGDTDPAYEARMCGRDVVAWARQGLIDDYFLATYTQKVGEMAGVVSSVRALVGSDVRLMTALSPFNRFLTTNDQMEAAARAQLSAGADGIWIYRSDYLEDLGLWEGAQAAGKLID
jgi:uncharacterized lipoprotein YddW (UPF0748 family)